jgi:type VI secretion system protein VasD
MSDLRSVGRPYRAASAISWRLEESPYRLVGRPYRLAQAPYRSVGAAVLAFSLLFTSACEPTIVPVKEPRKVCEIQTVSLSVVASDTINPSPEGEPRPVVVRVYQLRDEIALYNSTFDEVWRDDKEALGGDLIMKGEAYAYPNTRTEVAFQRNPEADSVVVAALYRGHQGKSWFMTFELPPAPGKGDCRVKGCEGDDCGADPNPKFAIWLDDNRVEEGSNHLQDITDDRRVRVVNLGKSGGDKPSPAPESGVK